MATTERDSGLLDSADAGVGSCDGGGTAAPDSNWLDGDVLACACPDCQAPMSIRLWLRLADCWRCGTCIELTEEQERQAWRLLEARQAQTPQAAAPVAAIPTANALPASVLEASTPAPAPVAKPAPHAQPRIPLARPAPRPAPVELRGAPVSPRPAPAALRAAQVAPPDSFWRRVGVPPPIPVAQQWQAARGAPRRRLPDFTSWLVSAIVHMLAVILLGLLLVRVEEKVRPLVLATAIGPENEPGDATVLDVPRDADEFDPSGAERPELAPQSVVEIAPPETDVMLDPEIDPFAAARIDRLLASVTAAEPGTILAGRDPRVREQLALQGGGTIESEAAVARALKWLAEHQHSDGHWGLHDFHHAADCACTSPGTRSDEAATALALLPFLGAGQTHRQGDYRDVVRRGLRWLIDAQRPSGDLRGRGGGQMYAHGLAAIALCEAYALSRDADLHDPLQRAIDFIVEGQHRRGGWRYVPGQPGDTSVVGWQLMALRSGQMAYLNVPDETFARAARFLDSVQTEPSEGLYGYMPGHPPSAAMTAEGLLSRQYSGWPRNHRALVAGVDYLLERHPPQRGEPNVYYWYYATQVMHHMGGRAWDDWNFQLRDRLVAMQERTGHEAGSWTPRDVHDRAGGRLYMTALAACTLEVYYRHLPLYGKSAVDGAAPAPPRSPAQPPSRPRRR